MTWYALITAPQKEFATDDILRVRGITTCLPYEERYLRRAGRRRCKELRRYAMFPRYLFAKVPTKAWADVLRIKTVSGVVRGAAGHPAQVPDRDVERCATLSGADRPRTNIWRSFTVGDMVFVTSGPLAGQVLPISGLRGRIATVRAMLLSAERDIKVPVDHLEAA